MEKASSGEVSDERVLRVCDALGLSQEHVLNVYVVGSRVWGRFLCF